MKRILTIKGRMGRFDEPSFLLAENEPLCVLFYFPEEIRIGNYLVVARHGNASKKTFTLGEDKLVKLSADWLQQGGTENVEFSLCLTNQKGTRIVKDDYMIEPLKIQNVDGNFIATATIFEMEKRQAVLEEKVLALEERVAEYENGGTELKFEE